MLEILYLFSHKYNPKEILSESKIKREIHTQMNSLLITASQICANNLQIHYQNPNVGIDKVAEHNVFHTIIPLSPSIYELHKIYLQNKSKFKNDNAYVNINLGNADENYDHVSIESAMFEDWENKFEDHHLNERYRLFCFKTHKRISLTLIQNTYSPEKIDRIIKRVIL